MLPFFLFFVIKFLFIIKKRKKHRQISVVFIIPNTCAGLSLNVGFPLFDPEIQDAIVPFMGYH